ncbi:flavodoxin FldA [Paramagnetospirillum caucaseum]|uniref:Flavodoxin n=1 Tax=Paramagnetospirillum caucaseum TaxID=1244869 RepID=M2Z691_9PROT|nr:flavodoxin FldA [Paramagnetospirillum caucaseum]EME69840.1 flavodoxin FldA [Paramagnetospirillum caucaseum]
MNVTVIFGSDSGVTKAVAATIAKKTGARLLDVQEARTADYEGCDLLILGSPTYGMGELQTDWDLHLSQLEGADLSARKVALFGTGDQMTYPDSFVDAMGILYDKVVSQGAEVVGFTDTVGYDFTGSTALRGGRFVGLALDEDTQSHLTSARIDDWLGQLR